MIPKSKKVTGCDAIVLCGGLGTRLRSLYPDLPKALAPIHGRPFIEYLIESLLKQGIRDIHIAAGYKADQIRQWSNACDISDVRISVSIEPTPLGTAGGIKYALKAVQAERTVLVLNGDSLLPNAHVDLLAATIEKNKNLKAVIAAVEMTESGPYGTLEIDCCDRITSFREKTENTCGWVNGGIYYLNTGILDAIQDGVPSSMEKDIFPQLAASGLLSAVKFAGPLLDMGTPEGHARMNDFFDKPGQK